MYFKKVLGLSVAFNDFCCVKYFFDSVIVFKFGMMVREFTNGPGDLGSIPGQAIPKTQKMVLTASLLNTQHHKVQIKGKVE